MLEDDSIEIILVDVVKCLIERPGKQRQWYSGKKKKHTIKPQVIVNKRTKEIICIAEDCGKTHDFKLYKDTIGGAFLKA